MIPEDYEPYPDDGEGVGDYPKLKNYMSEGERSGFVNWDMPHKKRNFGEPLHRFDLIHDERWAEGTQEREYSPLKVWLGIIGIFFVFVGLPQVVEVILFGPENRHKTTLSARQVHHRKEEKHYLFELEGQE